MNLDPAIVSVAQTYQQAYPAIPWQVWYAWIKAEGGVNPSGSLGAAYYNPLNLSWSPYQTGNVAYVGSAGEHNTMAVFSSWEQGAQAVAWQLSQPLYAGVANAAANSNGNVENLLNAIQSSGWATSGYNGGFPGLYYSIFGSYDATSSDGSGGGFGSTPIVGGVWNGIQWVTGQAGNAIGGAAGAAGGAVTGGVSNLAGGAVGTVQSWLQTMFHIIGKWIILALIAIGMFILFDQLVSGGKGSQMAMAAAA